MPAPVMERLNKELNAALKDPAVKRGLREGRRRADRHWAWSKPRNSTPMRSMKYRDIITKAGIAKIE